MKISRGNYHNSSISKNFSVCLFHLLAIVWLLNTSNKLVSNALYEEKSNPLELLVGTPNDLPKVHSASSFANVTSISNQQPITPAATSEGLLAITSDARNITPVALLVEVMPVSSIAISTTTENINDYVLDEGLCALSVVMRKSIHATTGQEIEVSERALACSQVNDKNHLHMIKSIYKKNKLNIQQLQITNSEPLVLLPAIDFICSLRFNCSRLKVFNITGQKLQESSGLNSWLSSWPQLEVLDLSNTTVKLLESVLQGDTESSNVILQNLTTLYLDNNYISELNFDHISVHLPNLRHLSLVNNKIFNISCNETSKLKLMNRFESINIANNSISCEKSQIWFIKQIVNLNHKFPDHDQIKCSAPERLIDMTWIQRVSVLETKICDDCDCKSLKKTAISVDCHNKNLIALPDILPLNTKVLNLTSNQINSLGVPLNSKNWENVTYVYLENNLISSFKPLETNPKFMRNLAALDIRRNKFQEFPSHIFEQFINLDQVHLSNNPWLCDCESTFAFQEWLQRQFHKVGDKEEIMCGISGSEENGVKSSNLNQRLSARVIYRLDKSELCPQENLEDPQEWLNIVNLLLSLSIVLILLKVTMDYIYQHRTKRLPHFFKLNF